MSVIRQKEVFLIFYHVFLFKKHEILQGKMRNSPPLPPKF